MNLRHLVVDFDSGSSDFFLPGPKCTAPDCQGHRMYNPAASSSAVDQGKNFSTGFGGGGMVDGEIFTDTVNLGGLIVKKQAVVAASTYNAQLGIQAFPPDGLLGLAFPSIAQTGMDPVFQTLVKQGTVTKPEFGFTFLDNGGELFLGGSDTSHQAGSLRFTPVSVTNPPAFWQINAGDVLVGAKHVVPGPNAAIVDTGTTLIIVDDATAAKIYGAIPGAKNASATVGPGFFTFPCDQVPNNVAFELAGYPFTLSQETINFGQVAAGSPDCAGGIMGGGSSDFWILGDVLLRNLYTREYSVADS